MTTVFIILGLVVVTGKLLIRVVNKYYPTPKKVVITKSFQKTKKRSISNAKVAAIFAAVEHLTKGKGTVVAIEKDISQIRTR